MDVLAVHGSAREAVLRARAGEGPTLLEFLTYRYAGHSRGDPGGYRTKEELHLWRAQDPIPRCSQMLMRQYGASEEKLQLIDHECQQMIEQAVEFARASPDPLPDQLLSAVYASGGSA
jgi:pyruvate dehydrogenase E1 component alpha subunit